MTYPKVGILCPVEFNLPPDRYGPWELVCYNLAEALVQLGVDVTVFATKKAKTKAKVEYLLDQPLEEIPRDERAALTTLHIIDALKKAKNVDIIHNSLNIHPVVYAQLIETPMVTTLHGAASEKSNHAYYKGLEGANFISISQAERAFYPSLNYIDTVYNGVDFSTYSLKNDANAYLVFSGRIVKEKGILSAIELSKRLKIPLKIAGIITDQTFYDEEVLPQVDGKQIQYVGNLRPSELIALLKDALALVAMFEWNEPFGLSVLDALAMGVAVIGSSMGAMPEIVTDSRMGIIVKNVEEAVSRIGEIYAVKPDECRAAVQARFSREVMAKRYLENYLKLA